MAVPDLCGACITALQRDFEDRCRWESLAADTLAREAHQRRLGYADTHESRDYDALPPLDRSRTDAAAAVCLRSLDPEWRRVALDRAAERLVQAIVEAAPVLALYTEATRATKVPAPGQRDPERLSPDARWVPAAVTARGRAVRAATGSGGGHVRDLSRAGGR